ncbi:Metacaspase-9 [Rhynchospora pubera]|uniref:Metacaspase-9 n=1 Tax=Rhynchospora pubera TaxID=906938 RepID=A0AAV8H3L5_9POAL|nr:Metacaspase-9 [Rhynchospora pubera]
MAVAARVSSPKKLALLVGCNYFTNDHRYLPELSGCINDVRDMAETLVSRFGFDRRDITVLTDEAGSHPMPTGANIKRALTDMIKKAKSGDVLVFHFSGHGTRLDNATRDEAIIPCDSNCITDVDFRQIVDLLPSGTTLTIISDSCHSGGLINHEKEQIGPSTVKRSIDAKDLKSKPRFIPHESLLQHLSGLSGIESQQIGDHLAHLFGEDASDKFLNKAYHPKKPIADNGILLSGCQADQFSEDLSPEGEKPCGAFTNSFQKVLAQHPGTISYKELVTKVRQLLRSEGFDQNPCLYCSDSNAVSPFLSQKRAGTKDVDIEATVGTAEKGVNLTTGVAGMDVKGNAV